MPAKATWRALTVDAAIDIDSDTYESDRQEYKVQQLLFDQHCPAMTFYWRLNHGETSECAQPHDVNLDKRPLVTAGADSGMYTSTGGTLFFYFFYEICTITARGSHRFRTRTNKFAPYFSTTQTFSFTGYIQFTW